jgi:hypothetical protein
MEKRAGSGGTVAYCAICGQDHEPGVPCAAHYTGGSKSSPKSFARAKRAADRAMIQLAVGAFLVVLVLIGVLLLVAYVIHG